MSTTTSTRGADENAAQPDFLDHEPAHRLIQRKPSAQLVPEMADEQKNVVSPLGQGRDLDGQGVQPVAEVPPEAALLHLFFQGLVGGRHNAHVDANDPARPPPA